MVSAVIIHMTETGVPSAGAGMVMHYPDIEGEVELAGGVKARVEYAVFDDRQAPFPLSPIECWYLVQGWAVKPAGTLSLEDQLDLPGRLEGSSHSYLVFKGR
jgi:hypothetical protein